MDICSLANAVQQNILYLQNILYMSNMIAPSHIRLLSSWNTASATEALQFSFCLILIGLNLNIQLVASLLGSIVLDSKEVFSERVRFTFGSEGWISLQGRWKDY